MLKLKGFNSYMDLTQDCMQHYQVNKILYESPFLVWYYLITKVRNL